MEYFKYMKELLKDSRIISISGKKSKGFKKYLINNNFKFSEFRKNNKIYFAFFGEPEIIGEYKEESFDVLDDKCVWNIPITKEQKENFKEIFVKNFIEYEPPEVIGKWKFKEYYNGTFVYNRSNEIAMISENHVSIGTVRPVGRAIFSKNTSSYEEGINLIV